MRKTFHERYELSAIVEVFVKAKAGTIVSNATIVAKIAGATDETLPYLRSRLKRVLMQKGVNVLAVPTKGLRIVGPDEAPDVYPRMRLRRRAGQSRRLSKEASTAVARVNEIKDPMDRQRAIAMQELSERVAKEDRSAVAQLARQKRDSVVPMI